MNHLTIRKAKPHDWCAFSPSIFAMLTHSVSFRRILCFGTCVPGKRAAWYLGRGLSRGKPANQKGSNKEDYHYKKSKETWAATKREQQLKNKRTGSEVLSKWQTTLEGAKETEWSTTTGGADEKARGKANIRISWIWLGCAYGYIDNIHGNQADGRECIRMWQSSGELQKV